MFKKKKTEEEEIAEIEATPATGEEETEPEDIPETESVSETVGATPEDVGTPEKKSKKKKKDKKAEEPAEKPTAGALWKIWAHRAAVFCLCFVYTEVVLHLFLFKSIDWKIIFPIFFSLFIAGIFAFFALLMPKIPRRIFTIAIVAVVSIFSEVQLVYHSIFKNLMPMNLTKMGGNAMGNFRNQTMYAIGQIIVPIIVLLVPVIFTIVLAVLLRRKGRTKLRWYHKLTTLAIPAVFALLFFGILLAGRNAPHSMWKVYDDPDTSTDKSYKNVGMLATTIQETRYMIFGDGGRGSTLTILNGDDEIEYTSEKYNMIDSVDLEGMVKEIDTELEENKELTKDEKEELEALKDLDEYVASLAPTPKNEYTGALKGYNVVLLPADHLGGTDPDAV